jgi:hypothetical protein
MRAVNEGSVVGSEGVNEGSVVESEGVYEGSVVGSVEGVREVV